MISKACDLTVLKNLFKILFLLLFTFFLTKPSFASQNSFVTVVNPVRGNDFYVGDQSIGTSVIGESDILKKYNVSATWLIRYDAFLDSTIVNKLKNLSDEKGLFLEVTPTWAKEAGVEYAPSAIWHDASSALLTGYERVEREKLIDKSFEKFKQVFGFYPKSVGAWWVDSYSLSYMKAKYGIVASLIVADQYTTDNYQIWGQYFSTPYYPSKNNALHPAGSLQSKLGVVMMQWAPRDPVNSYGNGVEESTFSVQANDYLDYHNLNTNYFSKLIDIYTKESLNSLGQVVVGLENSYDWSKYKDEYQRQIKTLVDKKNVNQLSIVTMSEFAFWYQQTFPNLSPNHVIVADDPLGTYKKVVWFMNPYYRAGWFVNADGSVIRDVRQYIDGEEEICFSKKCATVNFATFATRVLDEVSFGHKLIIDEGKISNFNVKKSGEKFAISYKNEAGKERVIEFLEKDISIDGKVSSIDSLILEATKHQLAKQKEQGGLISGAFSWSLASVFLKIIKFLGFLLIGCVVPGLLLVNKVLPNQDFFKRLNIGLILGLVLTTVIFYISSLINLKQVISIYLLINVLSLIKLRRQLFNFSLKFNFLTAGLILAGTIFQQLPTFKNGLNFPYGLGFWGPNTHDGFWHVSLINSLVKSVPPQNPIFSGEVLKNYHYFYDLLVAATNYATGVPVLDLLFRFYPLVFSLSLGIGTYYLIKSIKKTNNRESELAILFGIYLVYFSGSFGWIVEYIKQKHLGGESAFWANQSISFNLNPPFAISLLIVIAILQLLPYKSKAFIILTVLTGTLISFKAYAGVLILLTFLLIAILKRSKYYLLTFTASTIISAILFLSNFSVGKQLIIFSPFWFIHSMIDSPDRVGWTRLSLARMAGLEQKNWFKFFSSEAISLLIFIFGNLGTRIFALFSLTRIKKIISDTNSLFILIFSILSLFIPTFFIQAGNPWNTIQFLYYFLYIAAVVGGLVLASIFINLPKLIALPLIAITLIITPINSWATANGYLSYQPHAYISKGEFKGLEFLKSQQDGIVLSYPYDSKLKNNITEPWPLLAYDSTAYISAFSKKAGYLQDEGQNQILLTEYKKRIVASKDFFFSSSDQQHRFLEEFKIKYIYIPKIFNKKLDESLNIKNIFENQDVIMYQYK